MYNLISLYTEDEEKTGFVNFVNPLFLICFSYCAFSAFLPLAWRALDIAWQTGYTFGCGWNYCKILLVCTHVWTRPCLCAQDLAPVAEKRRNPHIYIGKSHTKSSNRPLRASIEAEFMWAHPPLNLCLSPPTSIINSSTSMNYLSEAALLWPKEKVWTTKRRRRRD